MGLVEWFFAVWDVSASPAIDKNNLQFAYENSAGSNAGDITNFTSQVSWWYSVDDGAIGVVEMALLTVVTYN